MRNSLKIIFAVILLSAAVLGCSQNEPKLNVENYDNESRHMYDVNSDEKIKEMVFSWYKKNHYEYEEENEKRYLVKILSKDIKIYGKKCYVLMMYFDGWHHMEFVVSIEDGELYTSCYDNFTYVPLNNIMVLNDSKYLNEIKEATNVIRKKCKKNNIDYCDTVMRLQKVYFLFGEYDDKDMEFKTMYLFNAESRDVFIWDLEKDAVIDPDTGLEAAAGNNTVTESAVSGSAVEEQDGTADR